MKQIIILLGAISLMVFTSCLKSYTCDCTLTENGKVINTSSFPIEKSSKKDATKNCNNHEASYTQGSLVISQTCDLN